MLSTFNSEQDETSFPETSLFPVTTQIILVTTLFINGTEIVPRYILSFKMSILMFRANISTNGSSFTFLSTLAFILYQYISHHNEKPQTDIVVLKNLGICGNWETTSPFYIFFEPLNFEKLFWPYYPNEKVIKRNINSSGKVLSSCLEDYKTTLHVFL